MEEMDREKQISLTHGFLLQMLAMARFLPGWREAVRTQSRSTNRFQRLKNLNYHLLAHKMQISKKLELGKELLGFKPEIPIWDANTSIGVLPTNHKYIWMVELERERIHKHTEKSSLGHDLVIPNPGARSFKNSLVWMTGVKLNHLLLLFPETNRELDSNEAAGTWADTPHVI